MEFEDSDMICFKYHYYLSNESARRLSELFNTARSTANKEEARHLMSRLDTFLYRECLAAGDKVCQSLLLPMGID